MFCFFNLDHLEYEQSSLDIIYLIDSSRSIGENNFKEAKKTVVKMIENLETNNSTIKVGLINYSTAIMEQSFFIKSEKDKETLVQKISNMPYLNQSTASGDALNKAFKIFDKFGRTKTPRVVLILTDGKSNVGADVFGAAKILKDSHVIVYAVGIKNNINFEELSKIASSPSESYVKKLTEYELIISEINSIIELHEITHSENNNVNTTSLIFTTTFPVENVTNVNINITSIASTQTQVIIDKTTISTIISTPEKSSTIISTRPSTSSTITPSENYATVSVKETSKISSSLTTSIPSTSPLTTTTTSARTTTPITYGYNFTGKLKLNIPIKDSFQRLFSLPNGDFIRGSGWKDTKIEIWDSQQGIVKRILTSVYQNPNLFGLLSNGYLISSHAVNKTLLLWDLSTNNNDHLKKVIQIEETLMCLTVLKNDDLALGQSGLNFDIIIRNGLTGLVKRRLIGHTSTVYQIKRIQNDKLVSCSADTTARIWSELDGSLVKTLPHSSSVYSIEILKNGYLAAGLNDNSIYIWDINTGNLIRNLRGHGNIICNYECLFPLFNGDLLSGSYDRTLKLWNPLDGSLKLNIEEHKTIVRQLVVTYSKNLISVSTSEILIWN
ncbi:unnamed protein product [Brachionus calyciflorus]|uniref:VWFA domain-containing protein n=1 Tax=Brachionus calyciflorus TaxID=104777 RepID=A0A813U8M1_9BILA|nr:unnamed protein product [Brachionus calyciflorus]